MRSPFGIGMLLETVASKAICISMYFSYKFMRICRCTSRSIPSFAHKRYEVMTIDWLIAQFDQSIGHWSELAGYLASVLVFLTFCMKTIVPLRMLAISSNIAFIVYAVAAGLMPVLLLHATLLPLNILRTVQQIRPFAASATCLTWQRQDRSARALHDSQDLSRGHSSFSEG